VDIWEPVYRGAPPPWLAPQDAVYDIQRVEADVIEKVCSDAITDESGPGVRVDRHPEHIHAYTSPDVPYGELHERWMY
jgi:hypothetical protein